MNIFIFEPEYLLSGKDGACGSFARGHYTVGWEFMVTVNEGLRKLVDKCDNIQGFIMNHSVGGGTGSGLGALILEQIGEDYTKKQKYDFAVYPFDNNHTNNTVEPFNALFTTHWSLGHSDITFVFDNRQLHNLCKKKLLIRRPSYYSMNSIISKISSGLTMTFRFEGAFWHNNMNELYTNLVPFPRLHFITNAITPLIVSDKNKKYLSPNCKPFLINGFVRRICWKNKLTIYLDVMDQIYNYVNYGIKIIDRDSIKELTDDMFNSEYFSITGLYTNNTLLIGNTSKDGIASHIQWR